MKEELEVKYEIPNGFINKIGETYSVSEEFKYSYAVDYIKNYSMKYWGIDVEVDVDELIPTQSEYSPEKWSITYRFIDSPNYEKLLNDFGFLKMNGPTELMLRPSNSAKWNAVDYKNIMKLYREMFPKPTRLDIFKSMIKSVKTHIKMMK